jgi:tetratricopeptide (TPR) repeat protein
VLARLAELYDHVGSKEDAAKHHKILALSHLENREFAEARARLRKSLALNPRDIPTWQRLWECVLSIGDEDESLAFGKEFLAHFKKLGLMEIVRDHTIDLGKRFPGEHAFRVELAEAHFALGDQKEAVACLFLVGNEHLSNERYDQAEKIFRRVLKFDHRRQKARKICEEIRSGKAARRRQFFRKFRRDLSVAAVLALSFSFIWREVSVQGEFLDAMRVAIAERTPSARTESARRSIDEIRAAYPYSITASFRGDAFLRTLSFNDDDAEIDLAPSRVTVGDPLFELPPTLLTD